MSPTRRQFFKGAAALAAPLAIPAIGLATTDPGAPADDALDQIAGLTMQVTFQTQSGQTGLMEFKLRGEQLSWWTFGMTTPFPMDAPASVRDLPEWMTRQLVAEVREAPNP